SIRDNNIQNITNNNTGSAGTGIGISTSGGGVFSITGNTIANLSTRLSTSGVGASSSIVGITQTSANTTPHAISGNRIYNLSNNNTTGAATVTGIHFSGGTAFSAISKNLVYNLKSSNFPTSGITGIHISTVCIVSNNMVRLGYDAAGASIDLPVINGIFKDGTVTTRSYFNSIYIGGTSSGAANSYAFRKSTATQDSLRNNIFVNERTGGTGKNYAVTTTAATAAAVNSNYNLLYTPNANGVPFGAGALGIPTVDYTLATWNTTTIGQDANSLVGTPNFVSATSTVPDLHLQSPTAAEAAGIAISYINDDFDGDDRSLNTPTDIGADAGQFLPQDILPPSISYTAYTNACNDMPYAVSATITDNVSVSTVGNTAPRIYFKRTTDANTYNGNTSATQGWKYVVATNTTSPFSFNLDFNLLYGGPHANDSIQYFVIAQDASANTTVNSGTLALAAPVAGVALTAANFPTTGAPNYFVLLPCSGVVTVGTGGNYGVFTTNVGVFNAINQVPALNGNLILRVVSDITIEDGSVALNQWNENGLGGYTVTIEPDANVLRSVSGTSGSNPGLFRINGADRVIFNGGSGTNKYLKFSNTLAGASASTINLTNDATGITINNCILEGGANSTTHGVVTIGAAATSGTGNDNISITTCDIKAYNTNYPTYGVLAIGTTSRDNNDVTIADCNIYDNYSASIASSAILVNTGNNSFNITNNRIYQTVARTGVGAVLHTGIRINNTTAGGFNITGNQIGGVDALGNGTMAYTSATTMQYAGIHVASIASTLSTVLGNSIKNVSIASTNIATGSNAFSGIYVSTPSWVNILGNNIGSTTDTASIAVSITANSGTVNGIKTESVTATKIDGNTIAGIKAVGTSSNAINLIGVSTTAGNDTIVNNTIGSTNVPHSIMVRGGAVSTASSASGITAVVAATYAPVISNNTISNISNLNATANTANQQASGILASGNAYYNITGNTVRNITGYSASAGVGSASSVVGISLINGAFANNITGNTVYNLVNGAATGTPVVTGINYQATTGVANVNKNFVYNLQSNAVAGATITGLHLSSVCVATNNMVRLGYDAGGNAIDDASVVNGILKDGAYSTRIYFNSVYVGGAASSGTSNTFAFRKNSTNQDTVRNNIFVNERSGGTGKHYGAMYFTNTTTSIISDYNIVYAPNANGILIGTSNPAVDYTTLNSWSSASSGQDVNSLVGAPNYVAPLAAVPNLHIQSPTIAEGNGINTSYILDDFDGDVRNINTPTDIGADAGLFLMLDIFPPVITYTPIPTQDICIVQPASIQVTVTDIHTGISLSSNKPRMYMRKSAGSGVNAWGAYPSIEGTFVSGNSNVSTWNFVVDYTLLGATVVQGDQFEYYFVAQDDAPVFNVGYSQQSNNTPLHSNVATVVTPPNFALTTAGVLSFQDPLSGTVTVGTGGTYTTFNGPLGLFYALNTRGLNGNLTVEVISDVNENVAYQPLGVIPEYCGIGYSVLIRPSQAVVRQITQSTGGSPMISLIGAKRVTFDGAYNGTSNYFLFRQSQNTPVFFFNGVASGATEDITIKNSTIEGNSQATTGFGPGTISFAGIGGTGQAIRYITIDSNFVRNRSDLTQSSTNAPSQLVYGGGATASSVPLKSNITISNNALFNFINGAVNLIQNNSGAGFGDSINIIGNSIFEPINFPSYFQYPIILQTGNGGGHSISYNKIGGNALPNPDITGTWNNNHSDGEIVAINTLNGGASPYAGTQIIGNTISNMTLNGLIYTNFIGVRNEYGSVVISNNTIGGSTSANSIVNYGNGDATDITANSATIGIWNQAPNDEVIISNNTIANIGGVFGGYMTYHYTTGIQHG
ncbi:MAG: hypothetical protein JST49_09190, partial [Bacteroidetes bacterium]|nr:hypothetical protein [Bacteroidota bacterium]